MFKPTEQEFFERLEKADNEGYGWLIGHAICAISGGIVGFVIGWRIMWIF